MSTSDGRDEPGGRAVLGSVLVAAVAVLLVALVGLVVAALLPVPPWVFYGALAVVVLFSLASGFLAFFESRAGGRSFFGSLWGAVRAIFGFFFSFTF